MSGDDRLLSCLALLITALLGINELADPLPPVDGPSIVVAGDTLEARIGEIAEAIARAEGFYAPGEHDGRSLPNRLNNPGALKKPALGAAYLPTWEDTGLVIFPAVEMGWAALRHQVRLMLTGDSRIYHPSDTILTVANKYTGGDESAAWSARVASHLGVPVAATLADVAGIAAP